MSGADTLLGEIRSHWGWSGLEPVEIVAENHFANLIVRDVGGRYWRVIPEDLACEVVADNEAALRKLLLDEEFREDWKMQGLVDVARRICGPLIPGMKYQLRVPGPMGGEYGGKNLAIAPLTSIIGMYGEIARQVKDLPDGTSVQLNFQK